MDRPVLKSRERTQIYQKSRPTVLKSTAVVVPTTAQKNVIPEHNNEDLQQTEPDQLDPSPAHRRNDAGLARSNQNYQEYEQQRDEQSTRVVTEHTSIFNRRVQLGTDTNSTNTGGEAFSRRSQRNSAANGAIYQHTLAMTQNTPQRSNRKGHGALDFLNSHMQHTTDSRSLSSYLPGNAAAMLGKSPYPGMSSNYGRAFGPGQVARVKKNLYETSRQISRYKQLNKSGTLANRLNRAMPANTNFPEPALREKITSTGLETSKKFKLSNAEYAMNSQQFEMDSRQDMYLSQQTANQVNARAGNFLSFTMGHKRSTNEDAPRESHHQKPLTANANHRRVISMQHTNQQREGEYAQVSHEDLPEGHGTLCDLNSENFNNSVGMRARTEFNSPPDYGVSLGGMRESKQIVQSMQERNRQMRSEAKMQNQNLLLQDKIMEQQEEIKQLRQYLRDIFEQEEHKIVAASFEPNNESDLIMSTKDQVTGDTIASQGTAQSTKQKRTGRHSLSQQQTQATTETNGAKKRNLKAVSNIHQLYQDLFITDMKDEIAVASNEVVQLRQELLLKDQQMLQLRKQNMELKSKVQCYRRMVAENQKEEDEINSEPQSPTLQPFDEAEDSDAGLRDIISNDTVQNSSPVSEIATPTIQKDESPAKVPFEQPKTLGRQEQALVSPKDIIVEEEGPGLTSAQHNYIRTQHSMIVKDKGMPLNRPSPNKLYKMGKSSSLMVDSPKKFGAMGATAGTMSVVSRQSLQTDQSKMDAISDFIQHAQSVSTVMQCKTLRELIACTMQALKRVFKAWKVNFLVQDKDFVDMLRKEGAQVKVVNHAHQQFFLMVPENMKKEEFEVSFNFKNIADVLRGKCFSGRFSAAPVYKTNQSEQVLMIIQMELRPGMQMKFEEKRDKKAFEIIGKIMASIVDRIQINSQTGTVRNRAYKILQTFGALMSQRHHAGLCKSFEQHFPGLFNFEKCGLLLTDAADGSLCKLSEPNKADSDSEAEGQDENNPEVTKTTYRAKKPILMRLPRDRGITGLAIQDRQCQLAMNGEYHLQYAPEVDNAVGSAVVENCMIGPCIDSDGNLRGVIQLVNKKGSDPISFQDEREFENLLPTVAEMIRQADEVKYVSDISANLNLRLATSRDNILHSAKVYEERNISSIHAAVQQVVNRIDNFAKQKQQSTIKENQLVAQLFSSIREDEAQASKQRKLEAARAARMSVAQPSSEPKASEESQNAAK